MAILGALIDSQTATRAGDNLKGLTLQTLSHSLPATNPEMVLPILQSIQDTVGNGFVGMPALLGLGGNASLLTIGFSGGSAPSFPTVSVKVISQVFWSAIR